MLVEYAFDVVDKLLWHYIGSAEYIDPLDILAVLLKKDVYKRQYENRVLMTDFFASRFDNVSIQFCDVSRLVSQYELTTNNPHISVETYYRCLLYTSRCV